MVDHSCSDWFIEGCGHRFKMRCPRYIAGILSQILTGWAVTRSEQILTQYQISVAFSDDCYFVDSIVLNQAETHTDLINAINELIVNLAYLVSNGEKNFRLVHCAAFVEDKMMNVIVGKKNRGKSSLVYRKALKGAEIIADDLLIWQPKLGKFYSLGFPIRLRRPVLTLDGEQANPDSFFAGNGIAYSKKNAFHIAPAGKEFLLDRLQELDQNFKPCAVSILKTSAKLEEFIIGPEYTSQKKEFLEK
jgi:hypothetical protein